MVDTATSSRWAWYLLGGLAITLVAVGVLSAVFAIANGGVLAALPATAIAVGGVFLYQGAYAGISRGARADSLPRSVR
jgi:hypothetical protein